MSSNTDSKQHRENMRKMLDLIRFFDEGRWSSSLNYDIPNYADREMSLEQKWLTHFLGYITNRQMKFGLVFSKLDFIFSQLIMDYQQHSAYFLLLRPGPYLKRDKFNAVRPMDKNAQYAEDILFPNTETISAASRFFPVDAVAIFCTLKSLSYFSNKSLSAYMNLFLERAAEGRELESLLYGLWLLGYSNIGRWKKEELNHQAIFERCYLPKKEAIENYLFKNKGIPQTFRKQRFSIKRLTCFVRDLLKCDHFLDKGGEYLSLNMMEKLQAQLHILELPGDVWNNNAHFQECFFLHSSQEQQKVKHFNKMLREFYEKYAWEELGLSPLNYYPEQFDTTFDFVPRMCEKTGQTNCSFCPIGRSDGKIPKEFCLEKSDKEKFCPFLLYACGYKVCCKDVESCPNKAEQ